MTTIDTLASNNFFQLKDKTTAATDGFDDKAIAAQINSSAPSLAEAFMLDLSPDAQQALQGTATASGSSSSNSNSSGDTNARFSLTQKQQKQIEDILQKYKDAPFTQETYEAIQHDLEKAGLSPESLALQDKIKSFNPISILVNALGGGSADMSDLSGTNSTATQQDQDTKSYNFMGDIVTHWQKISTTAEDALHPDTTDTSDTGGDDTVQASSEAS